MSFISHIKIYILLVIVLFSWVRTKNSEKKGKKKFFHFPPVPQTPPHFGNHDFPRNDEIPEYIREQFARNKFWQDHRNHNFRPEEHPVPPFVPPRIDCQNKAKRHLTKLIIFGVSMFVLGVLVVVLLLYIIVYYYNKWLRKKERLFYKNLRYLIPQVTPRNTVNNNDNNMINNIDGNIVPNASYDLSSALSSDFEGINRKMYTNVVL